MQVLYGLWQVLVIVGCVSFGGDVGLQVGGIVEQVYVGVQYWVDQYLGGQWFVVVVVGYYCQVGGQVVVGVVIGDYYVVQVYFQFGSVFVGLGGSGEGIFGCSWEGFGWCQCVVD